jgi:hypothetical protein
MIDNMQLQGASCTGRAVLQTGVAARAAAVHVSG